RVARLRGLRSHGAPGLKRPLDLEDGQPHLAQGLLGCLAVSQRLTELARPTLQVGVEVSTHGLAEIEHAHLRVLGVTLQLRDHVRRAANIPRVWFLGDPAVWSGPLDPQRGVHWPRWASARP